MKVDIENQNKGKKGRNIKGFNKWIIIMKIIIKDN